MTENYRNGREKARYPGRGIVPGDSLLIRPAVGNQRTVPLEAREISIGDGQSYAYDSPANITLPRLYSDPFALKLTLDRGRYRLIAPRDNPFSLGGILTCDAFPNNEDNLCLGDNRLTFLKKRGPSHKTSLLEIENFERISKSPLAVFVEGETGTGKSHLARDIHRHSGRPGPFIHLNLSSFSEGLLESELFGHKKGAFTGALYDKVGALASAKGGTLFLDEIDSLSKGIQTKLLLFFDTGFVRPVGSNREEKVEAKIITSSGSDLRALGARGLFRWDFYYRITGGHKIYLPPLRQRKDKIREILQNFGENNGITMAEELEDFYLSRSWPGNLRQLYSHLNLKKEITPGTHWIEDFCDRELESQGGDIYGDNALDENILPLRSVKNRYVGRIFQRCHRRITETARALDIAPNTVKKILREEEIFS